MHNVGTIEVAKKKMSRKSPVQFGEGKPIIIAIRGSQEYKAWAEAYALHNRSTVTQVVERAMSLQAERDGFRKAPER